MPERPSRIPSSRSSHARGLEEGARAFEEEARRVEGGWAPWKDAGAELRHAVRSRLFELALEMQRKATRALRGTADRGY